MDNSILKNHEHKLKQLHCLVLKQTVLYLLNIRNRKRWGFSVGDGKITSWGDFPANYVSVLDRGALWSVLSLIKTRQNIS